MKESKINYFQMGIDDGFEDAQTRDNETWTAEQRTQYQAGYEIGVRNAEDYHFQQLLDERS